MKKSTGPVLYVGSPEEWPDIRHATGFNAPDAVVLLVRGKRLDLVVSRLEIGRAKRQVPRARVRMPEELELEGPALRQLGDWALALLRREKVQAVRVAREFPLAVARRLEQGGISLVVEDQSPLRQERLVKSSVEIEKIRVPQRAAVRAMQFARRMIESSEIDARGLLRFDGKPLTSERIRDVLRRAVVERGCIDSGTIVAGGVQGADPHEAGSGRLRAGELIVIDLFPRHLETGYWGDLTRTYLRGSPSDAQRAMYKTVQRAQREALGMIRAGVEGAAVHRRVDEVMREAGFVTEVRNGTPVGFIHGTGHGVGLQIHEAPTLSRAGGKLKAGMVVTVEPGLYYPEHGGVRIEDTVVVTESGFDYLARCPIPSLDR